MSAGFQAAEDTAAIEALDFELPCQGRTRRVHETEFQPCESPAAWAITYRGHCTDRTYIWLVCDAHLTHYMDPRRPTTCRDCGDRAYDFPSRVIRTERVSS